MNSVRSSSFNFQISKVYVPSDCKDIKIKRKFEFVAKIQLLEFKFKWQKIANFVTKIPILIIELFKFS